MAYCFNSMKSICGINSQESHDCKVFPPGAAYNGTLSLPRAASTVRHNKALAAVSQDLLTFSPINTWRHAMPKLSTFTVFLSTNAGKTWITNNILAKNCMTLYCLLFFFSNFSYFFEKLSRWRESWIIDKRLLREKKSLAGWCFEESCAQAQTRSWESRDHVACLKRKTSFSFCLPLERSGRYTYVSSILVFAFRKGLRVF